MTSSSQHDILRHFDSGPAASAESLGDDCSGGFSVSSHDGEAATHTQRDRDSDPVEFLSLSRLQSPAQNEFLYAMKEDLGDWLSALYGVDIGADEFLDKLETGVLLCRHANAVHAKLRPNTKHNARSQHTFLLTPLFTSNRLLKKFKQI